MQRYCLIWSTRSNTIKILYSSSITVLKRSISISTTRFSKKQEEPIKVSSRSSSSSDAAATVENTDKHILCEKLKFDNSFVKNFTKNGGIKDADEYRFFSYVLPEKAPDGKLVSFSSDCANHMVGLSDQDIMDLEPVWLGEYNKIW